MRRPRPAAGGQWRARGPRSGTRAAGADVADRFGRRGGQRPGPCPREPGQPLRARWTSSRPSGHPSRSRRQPGPGEVHTAASDRHALASQPSELLFPQRCRTVRAHHPVPGHPLGRRREHPPDEARPSRVDVSERPYETRRNRTHAGKDLRCGRAAARRFAGRSPGRLTHLPRGRAGRGPRPLGAVHRTSLSLSRRSDDPSVPARRGRPWPRIRTRQEPDAHNADAPARAGEVTQPTAGRRRPRSIASTPLATGEVFTTAAFATAAFATAAREPVCSPS